MPGARELIAYSQNLKVLYVEDDENLRKETLFLLEPLFKSICTAADGVEGFERYNEDEFDLVLTDINMPRMNGIELIRNIREINTEQKIMAISAHSESEILLDIIKAGVNGFILKPIGQTEALRSLYPICRDAYAQKLNIELVHELNLEKEKLERQNRELQMQSNTVRTKHQQVETLLQEKSPVSNEILDEYFAEEEDEGEENVVLMADHCEDLTEIFNEIPALLYACSTEPNTQSVEKVAQDFAKAAGILNHYTPYLDQLSSVMNELSAKMVESSASFMEILENETEGMLMLFDAVSSDMERYVKRFSVENLAMRNAHHIHEPTALSIQQIITMFVPSEEDFGDMEFFI